MSKNWKIFCNIINYYIIKINKIKILFLLFVKLVQIFFSADCYTSTQSKLRSKTKKKIFVEKTQRKEKREEKIGGNIPHPRWDERRERKFWRIMKAALLLFFAKDKLWKCWEREMRCDRKLSLSVDLKILGEVKTNPYLFNSHFSVLLFETVLRTKHLFGINWRIVDIFVIELSPMIRWFNKHHLIKIMNTSISRKWIEKIMIERDEMPFWS